MVRDLALLAARLAIGQSMAAHGAQKALGWFEGPGPEGASKMMESLGWRPGETFAQAASWNEIVSGELIALGLGGPIGPALMISNMLVAQLSVHAKNGFFQTKGGVELGVIYAAAALTFAAGDYGSLSLDRAIGWNEQLRHPLLLTLLLAGATAAAMAVLGAREIAPDQPATPTTSGSSNGAQTVPGAPSSGAA